MSILNTLTEGIVNRDMAKEGEALLNKWSQTGLLEGLQTERQQHGMARLLENQAKELLREASTMATGDVEGFAAVAFPIVRRVFAGLIANDLVSVQPMSLPSGLIFFLDFTFELDSIGGSPRMGNTDNLSIYGTNQKGSEIISGVDLINATTKAGFSGPGRDGSTGYAYASPSGSLTSAIGTTGTEKGVVVVEIKKSQMTSADGNPDFDNLSPMLLTIAAADVTGLGGVTALAQIRRLTTKVAAADAFSGFESIRFVYTVLQSDAAGTDAVGAVVGDLFALENSSDIPEINIKVDSTAITAQTKKLKAKWTPELGQDLNAYHNLDAEVELTSILSEQIALEIDREILADLVNGATAGTMYWSRSPGLFVNRSTGAELGASSAAPDFTGTVSEWYETLIETINDVSAQIHRKTLRGGANFVVCSPEVANILEFTAGFRANVTADADKGEIGANKVGSLSRKFDVIVDPYFPRNVVLVGRKGSSFLESGYVYAPYVPLQVTPTIFGVEDFVPRKGVMTRYAKKMVRPDMYGIVIVRGLMGEEYAP